MKKHIVLSVNANPDYLYYTPLVCWAWRKFGWNPVVFYEGPITEAAKFVFDISGITPILLKLQDGYRSDTITQVSRLYGACVVESGYLMSSDIDMIPLSDFWQFNPEEITVWGHDLTGFTHYPICYIGMTAERWREVMGLPSSDYDTLIRRDLDTLPQAKDPDFYKYWFSDQDLITSRIDQTTFQVKHHHRGQYPNGFARGRVDRGDWHLQHSQFIDCHALRDCYKRSDTGVANLSRTMRLLDRIWPDDPKQWVIDYTREFQKLANNG